MTNRCFRFRDALCAIGLDTDTGAFPGCGEKSPRRCAADFQEGADSPCLATSLLASLRVLPERFAPRSIRGWRGGPAAPPRPPLFLRHSSASGLAPACRLLEEACHG